MTSTTQPYRRRDFKLARAARAGGRIDDRRQRGRQGGVWRAAVPVVVNAGGVRKMRWACRGRRCAAARARGGGLTSIFRSLLVPVAARAGGRIDGRAQREQAGSVARAAVPAAVNAGGMRRMRWACGGRRRRGKRGAGAARTLRGGRGALPIAVGARRPRRAAQWQRHGCAGPEAAQKRAPGSATCPAACVRARGPSWPPVRRGGARSR